MSSSREISHKGRVKSVTPECTVVEIVSESACGACHARSLCSVSESTVKEISVPTSGWDNLKPGDEVNVSLKASMGHKAVWIAYVIPLVVLMAAILVMTSSGVDELVSGLSGIAAVAVYYLAIWLLRGRLNDEYNFNITQ